MTTTATTDSAAAAVTAGTAGTAIDDLLSHLDNLPSSEPALTQVLLILALGLLVRTAGMVSLCTTAFAAIGAVAFSQFAVG